MTAAHHFPLSRKALPLCLLCRGLWVLAGTGVVMVAVAAAAYYSSRPPAAATTTVVKT